ncbi:MAG: DNA gyrase C-terminal beta-propeller domain-containing protein, partial [Chloroflexota bacterium]
SMTAIMVTRNGKGVQFALTDVPLRQTRGAGGVRGIRLLDDDELVGMDVANPDDQLLVLTVRGFGKRTPVNRFRTTGRNVQGVIALKITDKTGPLAGAVVTGPEVEEVMVGSSKAMVYRTRLEEIRTLGRNTQGVMVMTKLADADRVISLSAFKERSWEEIPQLPTLAAAPKPPAGKRAKEAPPPAPAAPASPQLALRLDGDEEPDEPDEADEDAPEDDEDD